MVDKILLRKEQLAYLDRICDQYKVTLTEIARQSGISSTTLTRFYNNKNVKHCLSSTTLSSIQPKFPIEAPNPPAKDIRPVNDNLSDSELGIAYALQVVFQALMAKGIKGSWLEDNFIRGDNYFQKHRLPNAALVMQDLLEFLKCQSLPKEKSPVRQFAGPFPLEVR